MKRYVFPFHAISFVLRAASAIVVLLALLVMSVFRVSVGVAHAAGGGQHAPIVIQSDTDFMTCSCVVSSTGSTTDPYIIGPWTINNVNGHAVSIDGTYLTKSFELFNLTIAGNSTTTDTGMVLNHINPPGSQSIVASVYGVQTSIQTNNVGVLVENSSSVTLDGAGENPNGPGIANKGAGTINKNMNGAMDVENSSHITIEGWQTSTNGPSINPDWVTSIHQYPTGQWVACASSASPIPRLTTMRPTTTPMSPTRSSTPAATRSVTTRPTIRIP